MDEIIRKLIFGKENFRKNVVNYVERNILLKMGFGKYLSS